MNEPSRYNWGTGGNRYKAELYTVLEVVVIEEMNLNTDLNEYVSSQWLKIMLYDEERYIYLSEGENEYYEYVYATK